MNEQEFSSLIIELWRDLQHPDLIWQIVGLLACLALGKLAEGLVLRQSVELSTHAVQLGHRGLKRLVFPLTSLLCVVILRVLLKPWMHVNLLALAVPLLGSLATIRFVFFVLRLTFNQSGALASFERIFASVVWLGVALHIVGVLPHLIEMLEAVSFSLGKQRLDLWQLLQGLAAVAVALLVSLWLGSLVEVRLMQAATLDANLKVVFSRLSRALLILLAVMLSLPMVGIDLTALSVFGGALGVGLGFGLQKIASNYVAGFIILLDRSIRIGNTIAVGAEKGQVTQITTRYTVLRAGNGVESLVPNEALVSSTVQNETYSDSRVRHSLPVQISYADNPEQVMQLLVELALAQPGIAATPAPQALLSLFADSGINLELLFWIDDNSVSALQVRSSLNLAIWKAFAEKGISIPFPQREVRLISSNLSN